jgi:multidrug efflux pump subunit AcrB
VKRILAMAAANPVFANLLMILLVVAGLASMRSVRREMFPEFSFDNVVVTVIYPGAAPNEIEESITIKVEEAVRALDGVRKVESVSSEGSARITVEVDGAAVDPRDALVDVRNEVNRITTFPEDAEEPEVRLILNRREVMTLVLQGEGVDEETLTLTASQLEQRLLLLPDVTEVGVKGVRPYEITIAVREEDLQRYGLTFSAVSQAISQASLDLPLGKLRSDEEEQLLRVTRKRELGREFGDVPVLSRPDGTRILLKHVATIQDGFDEDELLVRVDGEPAVILTALRSSEADTIRVAEQVRTFVEAENERLPGSLALSVWRDDSRNVVDRLSLLTENGLQGLVLVFIVLLFFLGVRLSVWVGLGLPVAFLTALVLLEAFGGSLNMVSSFALIMILGILVDDSIVVGENIARHMREGGYTLRSAIEGLLEVSWPVIASVTTTVIAFLPLFFLEGVMGKFIAIMPVAVIACLIASLIECLLILPAHLAHAKKPETKPGQAPSLRERIDAFSDRFVHERYGPSLDWALRHRYTVLGLGAAFVLVVVVGLIGGGRVSFVFFPRLDSEYLEAQVTLPQGTAVTKTSAVARRLEVAALQVRDELGLANDGQHMVRRVLTQLGQSGAHKATVELELSRSEDREIKSLAIQQRWQELVGDVPELDAVTFEGKSHRPGGRPFELRLNADAPQDAERAAAEIREALSAFPGVFNVDDNLEPGKRELRFALKPEADSLGLRLGDVARQLYAGFSGREVHKLQRGRDEVEVRVRYDAGLRESQDQLAGLRVRLGDRLVPLAWAADIERGRSLSRIERRNGERVVMVMADVNDSVTNANAVIGELRQTTFPELEQRYPGLSFSFGGQQEEQRETLVSLLVGFLLALIGIYAILALLFGSYMQPVIVMLVIPVGFAGAILGHAIAGYSLAMFSIFGMVGLTGIVVNDSLVLIDFVNRARAQGATPHEAAAQSGRVRFRAVFLTTVTTVAGLLPILLERSLSAQFVIPMAISISAGVAAATVLTLYLVPAIYLIVEDVRSYFVAPSAPPEQAEQPAEVASS